MAKTIVKLAGNFVEVGWDDIDSPSLKELRGKRGAAHKQEVVAYLRAGAAYIVSPGYDEDYFDPSRLAADGSILTDGVYAWPSSLAYYVEAYDVALAPDFEAHMQRNHWKVPASIDVLSLQLPPPLPEAIQLNVYRHGGRFFVVPGAGCEVGFKDLDEVFEIDSADGLANALELGERCARAATELPMNQRFDTGSPWWQQAGFASYQRSVPGSLLVSIVRNERLTELVLMVPSPGNTGFDGSEEPEVLPRGTPLDVVAARVLAMFAADQRT